MADASDISTVAQVVSGGGLLAFAYVVWAEQRLIRPVLVELQKGLAAILEHVRGGRDGGDKP